jgi:DNA-binding transcriptional MerR regulator
MSAARGAAPRYQIRVVAKLTGIASDTLRAWERRYGAVRPRRDGRGRTYSEGDVARLRLLGQAVAFGHSIGRIANLDEAALRRLTAPRHTASRAADVPSAGGSGIDGARLRAALLALDTAAIDDECARLAVVLSPLELVRDALLPALREVGDAWRVRRGGIAQEHAITATVRHLLGSYLRRYSRRDAGVRLLFATPAGYRHEIGILCAAMLAASQGFGISYVGADMPAQEIVAAVRAARAQVLVLGLTLSQQKRRSATALAAIARGLPPAVGLWLGGPAATHHLATRRGRALVLTDFAAYQQQLARLTARA